MLAEQFTAAAAAARNFTEIDQTTRLLWGAHAAGHLPDADAQAIAEAIAARRAILKGGGPTPTGRPAKRASARRVVSPDRAASIARRRRCAMSGSLPAKIAASFTLGEIAALSIIAGECRRQGHCAMPLDAIAAKAGVCRTTAQNALRAARLAGLVTVTERPRPGRKNLPNIICIVSPEWRSWLRLTDRVQKLEPHEYQIDKTPRKPPSPKIWLGNGRNHGAAPQNEARCPRAKRETVML